MCVCEREREKCFVEEEGRLRRGVGKRVCALLVGGGEYDEDGGGTRGGG